LIQLNKKGKTLPAITFEVIRKQTQHENQAQPKKKISTPRNKIQQFYKKVVYIDPTWLESHEFWHLEAEIVKGYILEGLRSHVLKLKIK